MGRCCHLLDKVIRFYISLLVLFVSEHFVITFSLIFAFSPVISLCHWRRSVRISTLKCSWQTACTVLASAGSSPWMNLWNTTRKPPSLPANMERSCTWSNRCCDSYFCIHTGSDTHRHTCTLSPFLSLCLAVSHSLSLYTPNNIATLNRLNSSLSLGPFALASVLHPDPHTPVCFQDCRPLLVIRWNVFKLRDELTSPMMSTESGKTSSCFFVYHTVLRKPVVCVTMNTSPKALLGLELSLWCPTLSIYELAHCHSHHCSWSIQENRQDSNLWWIIL